MFIFATLVNSEEDRTKLEQIYIKYKNLMYYIANDILKDTHGYSEIYGYLGTLGSDDYNLDIYLDENLYDSIQ